MNSPKISIITINRNNAEELHRTVKSVINQLFTDYEYIVIDGGSADESVEVIKQYNDKITYWVSEPDTGIYNAMNKGIMKATGEYCYFLNSGDWLHDPQSLEKVFSHTFREDIIYTNCYFCKTPDSALIKATFPNEKELTFGFFIHDALCHQAVLIKRKLFDSHGLYDEQLKIFSDYKFILTAIVNAKASYKHIDEYISVYNHWGVSAKNLQLKEAERREILLKEFPFWARDYLLSDKEKYELRAIRNHPVIKLVRKLRRIIKK